SQLCLCATVPLSSRPRLLLLASRESRPRLIPPAANLNTSPVTPALGSLFADSPQPS
ncbi:hypothetical protein HAX54_016249, partial [Datura stramonium]|nr:hypothetical protein [Datura stramonium]